MDTGKTKQKMSDFTPTCTIKVERYDELMEIERKKDELYDELQQAKVELDMQTQKALEIMVSIKRGFDSCGVPFEVSKPLLELDPTRVEVKVATLENSITGIKITETDAK